MHDILDMMPEARVGVCSHAAMASPRDEALGGLRSKFGPIRAAGRRDGVVARPRRRDRWSTGLAAPSTRLLDSSRGTASTPSPRAGRQGQQVENDLATSERGLALLEGEHSVEGSRRGVSRKLHRSWRRPRGGAPRSRCHDAGARPAGADREHDPEVRQGQGRLVDEHRALAASRGAFTSLIRLVARNDGRGSFLFGF